MQEEITGFISDVGFPIAITVYLLFRFDRLITGLKDSVDDLIHEMKEHARRGN